MLGADDAHPIDSLSDRFRAIPDGRGRTERQYELMLALAETLAGVNDLQAIFR